MRYGCARAPSPGSNGSGTVMIVPSGPAEGSGTPALNRRSEKLLPSAAMERIVALPVGSEPGRNWYGVLPNWSRTSPCSPYVRS